ncbi:Hypothetical protein DEACI_0606 [Acididesulfobacillus acetoxydans]|uniref:Uncharacterized protein n=1 Tax=Acididesulfobacillus acetoxydans TaxID=1561005 RepID=A0A8S0X3B9_9FIRM|nr:Hypothetical protein DEACI_0606 [Acididesulfobacillus acetoxydans]CEJ07948.1 Hypothetical protein DEACI_2420 [Acididesulfobacillus acetoxydans]
MRFINSDGGISCKSREIYAIIFCEQVQEIEAGKVGTVMSPAEWFWKIFEATGSPKVYLLYRRYADN